MTKLIIVFRNFAKAPKTSNDKILFCDYILSLVSSRN